MVNQCYNTILTCVCVTYFVCPDGLSRPWNMNWRSARETCHHRTSTNSPPATSSSSCWTSCSHNTPAGTLQTHGDTVEKITNDFLSLSTHLSLKTPCLYLHVFTCFIIFLVLIMLSFVLPISISYYLLLLQPSFPMGMIKVLSYLIWSNTHWLIDNSL